MNDEQNTQAQQEMPDLDQALPLGQTLLAHPNTDLREVSAGMQEGDAGEGAVSDVPFAEEFPQMGTEPMGGAPGSAHYEASVQHYAHYDKSVELEYSPETVKSLTYAGRSLFGRFFIDLFMILTRPRAFWKGQAQHPATLGQLYFPHLIVLILARTLAVMGGALLQYALNGAAPVQPLVEAGVQALLIFVFIWLFALLISGISNLAGDGFQFERAHRFVGYTMTPIFVVGILSVLPFPYVDKICDIIAMPWAFLVLGAGILPLLRIKPEQAPTITALFCGMLLCMWGLIPMLIPRLIAVLF